MMAMSTSSTADNRDWECPVCHEFFQTPKVLPCGHTFCLAPCLKQLAKDKDTLKCPECRTDHTLPGGTVECFPTNILVIRMMGSEPVSAQPQEVTCPVCASDDPLVKCLHCSLVICELCRRQHTRELKDDVVSFVQELKQKAKSMELDTLENKAKGMLDTEVESFNAEVNTAVSSLIDVILHRKQKLLSHIQAYKERESADISSRLVAFEKEISELDDFCNKQISALATSDSTQTQFLKFKKTAAQKQQAIVENEEGIFSDGRMTLDVGDDDLSERINTFGSFGEVESQELLDDPGPTCYSEVLDVPLHSVQSSLERDIGPVLRCVGRKGRQDGQFQETRCLAVCPVTGNVVVGDSGNGRIQIFDENGSHLRSIYRLNEKNEISRFGSLKDIVVDKSGDVIALENMILHTYTQQGERVHQHGLGYEYHCSTALALDSKGFIHVCQRVLGIAVITKDGKEITRYADDTAVRLDAIEIAITEDDISYVTDVDERKRQQHFYVFNKDHQLIQYGDLTYKAFYEEKTYCKLGCTFVPGKMVIIENKYIVVADVASHRVRIFDFQWRELKTIGTTGHCQGQLYEPQGVAMTRKGELVVISNNNMLQFF